MYMYINIYIYIYYTYIYYIYTYVYVYHNGFLEDVAIPLIDKTDGRDPKNREN